jgi:hypothetical protein
MTPIELLLTQIDQAYDHRSWHGTNLRGSIRGLTPEEAVWRPAPRRHNIHELIVHCAYWKYVVSRRLAGGKRGSFALKGSNWFARTRLMLRHCEMTSSCSKTVTARFVRSSLRCMGQR